MARHPSPTLTPAELRIRKTMWQRRQATASEVVASFTHGKHGWKDSTVRTLLRILGRKGYLVPQRAGRGLLYHVAIDEAAAQRGVVRDLIGRFFDDSPERLVLSVLKHEDLDPKGLSRLRRLLDAADAGSPARTAPSA